MEPSIEIRIRWWDDDMIQLLVTASNGRYAGSTQFYATHDALLRVAGAFDGFPAMLEPLCRETCM